MTVVPRSVIMVGVDGSAESLTAARWAAREAELRQLSLLIVLAINEPVDPHPSYVFPGPVIEAVRDVNRKRLERAVSAIQEEFPNLSVDAQLKFVDPRRVLAGRSDAVAMTVVGTRGHGRLPEVLVGSVALHVAAHAHSPVAVVPPSVDVSGTLPPGPVLVGVDGHRSSVAAVGFAFEEAAARGVELLAVLVFDDLAYRGFAKGGAQIGLVDDSEERAVLAEQVAGWGEKYPDVVVHEHVLRGRVGETLVRCTRDESPIGRPSLVVVGTRGRGGLAGLLLGSTSQRLMTHSDVPVVVVRPEHQH